MWFYPLLLALAILAIAGGTLAGGIFTIVLVPLAGIVLISVLAYALYGRALEGGAAASADAGTTRTAPLPHQRRRPSGRAPTSPERLADIRRRQQ